MANPYPVSIKADDGVTELTGEATFTDPANQPGAYAPPTARAQYGTANPQAIGNGAGAYLTWDTLIAGTALLDITAPAAPTVITAGIYAISAAIAVATPMTAGGYYSFTIEPDATGDDPAIGGDSPAAHASDLTPSLNVTAVYYIPAGGTLLAGVHNSDGVNSIDFSLFAVLQRIT
jgi:hypothetical protein